MVADGDGTMRYARGERNGKMITNLELVVDLPHSIAQGRRPTWRWAAGSTAVNRVRAAMRNTPQTAFTVIYRPRFGSGEEVGDSRVGRQQSEGAHHVVCAGEWRRPENFGYLVVQLREDV